MTIICGANDWAKVVVMSQGMNDWLAQYVDMSGGVPCERTFKNIFNMLLSEALEKALQDFSTLLREAEKKGKREIRKDPLLPSLKGREPAILIVVDLQS